MCSSNVCDLPAAWCSGMTWILQLEPVGVAACGRQGGSSDDEARERLNRRGYEGDAARPVDSSPRWTVVQRATVCRCSVLTGRAHRRFGCVLLDSILVLTGR
jgi:hypothetical protein